MWKTIGSGPATVSVEAEQDDPHAPLVQLYETTSPDPGFGDLTPVGTHDAAQDDPVDTVHATVDAAKTYYVQVLGDPTAFQDTSFDFTVSMQFDNDLFANATQLDGATGTIAGTTVGATFPESSEPDPSGDAGNTVWYAWTASANGPATFSFAAGFDAAAAVYRGSTLDTLVPVDDESDSSSPTLQFNAQAGVTYHIQFGTYFDAPDAFTLDWTFTPPPANDDLDDAAAISGFPVDGTTQNATIQTGLSEPTDVDVAGDTRTGSNSVWYRWQPASNGEVSLTATPHVATDHAALVQLYSSPATPETFLDLTPVGTHPAADTVEASVVSTGTYFIQVMADEASVDPGFDFTLDLSAVGPPENDDWADAIALTGASGTTNGTNDGATVESGEPPFGAGSSPIPPHDTVWWKWVAPSNGNYEFDTIGSGFDTLLGIYTGSSVDALSELTVGRRRRRPPREPGLVRSGRRARPTTSASAATATARSDRSSSTGPPAPANDDFADAGLAGNAGSLNGTNTGASVEPDEPDPTGEGITNTVWYAWTPTATGRGTVSFEADFGGSGGLRRRRTRHARAARERLRRHLAQRLVHRDRRHDVLRPGRKLFRLAGDARLEHLAAAALRRDHDGRLRERCELRRVELHPAAGGERGQRGRRRDTIDVPRARTSSRRASVRSASTRA